VRPIHPTFLFLDSCTQHFSKPVQDNQQMLNGVVSVFLLYPLNYPDMFRHPISILGGLHVPRKLLQFCLRLGWMWIMVRSVKPAAAESAAAGFTERTIIHIHPRRRTAAGYTERTIIHIHPRRRQNWSSLRGTCNPMKMTFGCRNMSG
jgi:hypothetical protein